MEPYPLGPSLAKAFFTTSIAPVYIPGCAVCSLVLVRSNGCPAQNTWISVIATSSGRVKVRKIVNQPTRTAETPPAPPATNDLMDSLADEDPLVPVAGLLSTKLASSLYTESLATPCVSTEQSVNRTAHHRGRREKVATRSEDAFKVSFPRTGGHVIMSRRARRRLPVGRNVPILLLSEKTQITDLAGEGGGCFRDDKADEIILRETTGPATRPTTSRYV